MVIFLYEIGKILEAKAVNHTRKSISSLMDIRPEYANLKVDKDLEVVNPEDVKIGDIIVVKTGEKIPLDGKIVLGNAKINNSTLTGESKLVDVQPGDKVLSGSINEDGLIEVKSVNGLSNLGGEDFDNKLIEYCLNEFKSKKGVDKMNIMNNPRALRRLRTECEKAKKILSSATKTIIEIFDFMEAQLGYCPLSMY